MKGLIKIVGVTTVMLMLTSCIVHEHHGRRGLPPGQRKKVYIYEKKVMAMVITSIEDTDADTDTTDEIEKKIKSPE